MLLSLERVVVIGSSCAGKTAFAARLGQTLGQACTDLDTLFWAPNWQPKPREEFRRLAERVARSERWIVAGNYSDVRDILWPRATAVVWLNYAFPVVLWRAIKRTVRRVVTRETLWHGNRESFRRSFLSRDSILVWVASTFRKRRRQFAALRESDVFSHLLWVEFRRPAEAEHFLRSLGAASSSSIERTAPDEPDPMPQSTRSAKDHRVDCGEHIEISESLPLSRVVSWRLPVR